MLTLDEALEISIEQEHEQNIRKLAAIVREGDRVTANAETRVDEISAFILEAKKASKNALSNAIADDLFEKAIKLKIAPIDPMTRQIIY